MTRAKAWLLPGAWPSLSGCVARLLARRAVRNHRLSREELAAALCGLGLLGFLVHSFVDFNMHIPANAITAALLAGAYLRPLAADGADDSADPEEGDDD